MLPVVNAVTAALPMTLDDAAEKARQRLAWFGYLAMIFGNFMAILDIQIVAS